MLVRAVSLYLALFVADAGIITWLLLHDFNQRVVQNKLLEAHTLGRELAVRLSRELAPQGGIDQLRVMQRSRIVWQVIEEYISRTNIIDYAELRTPDGAVVLRHARDDAGVRVRGQAFGGAAPPGPESPPPAVSWDGGRLGGRSSERVIEVPLVARAGVLALGVTPGSIKQEADRLWREMMYKLLVGGLLSILLLSVAFLYVLRLIHKTRRLEADAQQAEQLAQLGTLASGLAHEIRNPLNAMNINLQMLEEELSARELDEESMSLLRSSRAEVLRLERLVKDFLAFARPARASRERLAPARLVDDVVRFLRPQFQEAGVRLELEGEELAPEVHVDAGQMRQALINVLQNALEASAPEARVVVRVGATPQGEALIEVADEGPGVPEELKERIFEVFWSRKAAGSGLGLSIARRAVENHGGRIDLDSNPGQGSTFRIVLPPAVAGEPRADAETRPGLGGRGLAGGVR